MFARLWGLVIGNPWVAMALVAAAVYGWIQWQDYRIESLKDDKEQLKQSLEVTQKHDAKVVAAFEDKGAKDHDREKFTREAITAMPAGKSPPAPALRVAYQRVFDRLTIRRAAENPR